MLAPALAAAQLVKPEVGTSGLRDLSNGTGIVGVAQYIINLLLFVAGIIAVLFIIIGGYQYIMSGANEELAEQGKKTLQNAVIGIVIIVLSYTIVSIIFRTLAGV